jgi:hypothetical protein
LIACAADVPAWVSSPDGATKKTPFPGAGGVQGAPPPLELPELPPLLEPDPPLVDPDPPLLPLEPLEPLVDPDELPLEALDPLELPEDQPEPPLGSAHAEQGTSSTKSHWRRTALS